MLATLGTGFVTRVLGIDAEDLGYILAPGGIGMILGIIWVGRHAKMENREKMINAGLMGLGITLAIFALLKPGADIAFGLLNLPTPVVLIVPVIGFLAMLLGVENATVAIPAQTALQAAVRLRQECPPIRADPAIPPTATRRFAQAHLRGRAPAPDRGTILRLARRDEDAPRCGGLGGGGSRVKS